MNAHGPNEFLHIDYATRLTAAVADVIAAQGGEPHCGVIRGHNRATTVALIRLRLPRLGPQDYASRRPIFPDPTG